MPSRPIEDIRRDVIEALEPREGLPSALEPLPGGLYRKHFESPLGLWCGYPTGASNEEQWRHRAGPYLDTAALIDAAWHARQYEVITSRTLTSSSFLAGVLDRSASDNRSTSRQIGMARAGTTYEAVVLALAQALGVETEEEQ